MRGDHPMSIAEWAKSTTTLSDEGRKQHEKDLQSYYQRKVAVMGSTSDKGHVRFKHGDIEAMQVLMLAKMKEISDDQSRREELQWNSIPQHWAWLQAHREVIAVQHFQSGPLKSLGTVAGTDPAITLRLAEIVLESIEAMFEAGEPVGFVTTILARMAAGLEPEAA